MTAWRRCLCLGLRADVALIRARRADEAGNLIYRMTEQNFNKAMATAADLVIAEVEEIVPLGTLDVDQIHTSGNYVDVLVEAKTTLADLGSSAEISAGGRAPDPMRLQIARRALAELKAGDVVNLGVGIPTLIADLIRPEQGIILHTENGMLGVGPAPEAGGALDLPGECGQGASDGFTRQQLFRQRRLLRHDPRRPYRCGGDGRLASGSAR